MSTNDGLLDDATSIDEGVEGVNRRLDEVGNLLESLLAQRGVTELQDQAYNPTPFEYAAVPQDGGRLGLPPGVTTLDFVKGQVTNENESEPIAEIRDFNDMSSGIDAEIQNLRSFYVYGDIVGKIQLDDGDWFDLESCQYQPIKSQGFRKIRMKAKLPYEIYGAASTRAEAMTQSDSVAAHMTRTSDLSAGTYDSWKPVPMTTYKLSEAAASGDISSTYAKPPLHAISYAKKTFRVENTSSAANNIDARIMAADTHGKDWYEIASATGISQGDHHVFHVTQAHHLLRLDIQNSTNGNTVDADASVAGVSP